MKFIEKFSGVFFIAGLVMFFGATISLGFIPAFMVDRVTPQQGLPEIVPEDFTAHYASTVEYRAGLLRGRDLYIREACWHCHSQFVRPVANENLRYGPVSTPAEYQTVLHLPQLLGTRRVGPDLSREAGKRSNDWHFAHLYEPTWVVPESVMPSYRWYFTVGEDGVPRPTPDAVALVAYLQVLGREVAGRLESSWDLRGDTMPPGE